MSHCANCGEPLTNNTLPVGNKTLCEPCGVKYIEENGLFDYSGFADALTSVVKDATKQREERE